MNLFRVRLPYLLVIRSCHEAERIIFVCLLKDLAVKRLKRYPFIPKRRRKLSQVISHLLSNKDIIQNSMERK
jgi:hypothetical protein